MHKRVFLMVLLISLAAIGLALMLPGGQPAEKYVHLPWQIEPLPNGSIRVFGIELGSTPLGRVENIFREPAEISLFATDEGQRVVEAYFNSITLSGIRARVVATLALSAPQLEAFYERGERISSLAQGKRKVSLSDRDLEAARQAPVESLTYLPRADLSEAIILKRFGHPKKKLPDPNGEVIHWLYPEKGLDIVVNPEGKEVLQYIAPKYFKQLETPLHSASK